MTIRLWTSETRVNTTTAGTQSQPVIVKLANGGFVVAWQDDAAGNFDIKAQLYNAVGEKVGTEIVVANSADPEQRPNLIVLPDGRFQVLWDNNLGVVSTRWYNADGTSNFGPVTYAAGTTMADVSAAARPDSGTFAVVEENGDILFIRRTSTGAFEQTPAVINTTTASIQINPDIARLSSGSYIAVWSTNSTDIRGRFIEDSGARVNTDFLINSSSVGNAGDMRPTVAALVGGGFVVTWHAVINGSLVRARLFDSLGAPLGPDFQVSTGLGNEAFGDVVALSTGGFLSVWFDLSAGLMRGAVFDARGTRVGVEFVISTVAGAAGLPTAVDVISAAVLDDGRVAVVWEVDNGGLGDATRAIHLQIVDPRDGDVRGTQNADLLYGGQDNDQIVAFGGADTVHALAGADVAYGGLGADSLFGGLGDDSLYGGDDGDLLNGGTGDDVAYGEAGDDLFFGELGDDLVFGQDGNDTLNGGNGHDAIYGQNGDDVTFGEGGDDAFFLGFGNDTAFAGPGADVAFGEEGGDSLLGEAGDDLLDGGAGGDLLDGGAGVDNLLGGADGDVLIGGADGDRLEGGAGGDVYWYRTPSEGNDLIVGFVSAGDQLQFTGGAFGFAPGATLVQGQTFIIGTAPTQAAPTFVYNNGALFFDLDGTGATHPLVFIALLQGAPALTAGDFQFT